MTLMYKPVADAGLDGDWPNPDAPPTVPPPPPVVVKAIMVPQTDVEYEEISETGLLPTERVDGFFTASVNLNEVDRIIWQTGEYKILQQDAYELQGVILAQSVKLYRLKADVMYPHA